MLSWFHTSDNSRVNSVVLYNSREWKYHHSVVLYYFEKIPKNDTGVLRTESKETQHRPEQ